MDTAGNYKSLPTDLNLFQNKRDSTEFFKELK